MREALEQLIEIHFERLDEWTREEYQPCWTMIESKMLDVIRMFNREDQLVQSALIGLLSIMWSGSRTGYCYFILAPHSLAVKIGYTANEHPAVRLIQLQIGTPEPLLMLGYTPGCQEFSEASLHAKFKKFHLRGEWFKFCEPIREFVATLCEKHAPAETLDQIPVFDEAKWNCDPQPAGFPSTTKEIEAWLSKPALY